MKILEDLKEMNEQEVLEHLAKEYSGNESGFDYGEISENDIKVAKEKLQNMQVLVAYESVGSWGCDSSSYFLLRDKVEDKMFEVHGGHCSCYGFEGQLDLEETNVKALLHRAENGNVFYCGGYDDNETENQRAVKEYILSLENKAEPKVG